MREFAFREIDIAVNYPAGGYRKYKGFTVESGDVESVMRWENTRIHNFDDERFDYISVAVESLLQVLGKEPKPDEPQKLIFQITNEEIQHIANRLKENKFPREFQPIPSEKDVRIYLEAGCGNIDAFLRETS